jgi:hypothetical protein
MACAECMGVAMVGRLVRLGLVVGSLLAINIPTVSAGGGRWNFDDAYVVGEHVVVTEAVWIQPEARYLGGIDDGPFSTFLVKGSPDDYPIPLPVDAIDLGPVLIEPRHQSEHGDVTLDFFVPQVEPGEYVVALCNDPCRKPLGDMLPTPITIAGDDAEARLLERIKRLETKLFSVRMQMGPLARRIARDTADQTRQDMEARVTALTSRIARAEKQIDALEASMDSKLSGAKGNGSVSALSLGALLLGLIAWSAFARAEQRRPGG